MPGPGATPSSDAAAQPPHELPPRTVAGGPPSTVEALFKSLYGELREVAERCFVAERAGHTLQPTALLHEAYLRLARSLQSQRIDQAELLPYAARAMREILVDHARKHLAAKRGGDRARAAVDVDTLPGEIPTDLVLDIDQALEKLTALDARQAKILELRVFAALSVAEVAQTLDMSKRSVEREWTMIRSWLRRELEDHGS
ncbi:MAG: ECF-type sigma factor [Pirellulales bacterium]